MKQGLWIALILGLCGCINSTIHSEKVFTNAQVLYQGKKQNVTNKEISLQMPSYFLDLEYTPGQTKLSITQINKIEKMLTKLDYLDEYHIYASFGGSGYRNQVANLANILKRGEDIKKRYSSRVKKVKVAYLKNQKSDSVYIRLLG